MARASKPRDDDEIEGNDESVSVENYPLDSVFVQRESRTIFEVIRRIKQGGYLMNPDFQRDFVWDIPTQSRLIESVLMRIPLPVFYLAENEEGRLIVVDGLQRLSTFKAFLEGELELELERKELNKKKFADLDPKLQNRIEDTNLIFYIIDSKVPERVRLNIFDRVNSGVPLTRQQMRNCIYMGKATSWLKAQAELPLFKDVTGGKLKSTTMDDRQAVNRFCAFTLCYPNEFSEEVDDFLARALKKMNKMPDEELAQLAKNFKRSLQNNQIVFGKHAFRKQVKGEDNLRPFNMALFDVFSVEMAKYEPSAIESQKERIREQFIRLLDDADFYRSISSGTAAKGRVQTRFSKAANMMRTVMHAHTD